MQALSDHVSATVREKKAATLLVEFFDLCLFQPAKYIAVVHMFIKASKVDNDLAMAGPAGILQWFWRLRHSARRPVSF